MTAACSEGRGALKKHESMELINSEAFRDTAPNTVRFFYFAESCGQCTPCREGTGWLYRMIRRIRRGEGTPADLDRLKSVADRIEGRTICALGDAAAWPVQSFLKHFRHEFEAMIPHEEAA